MADIIGVTGLALILCGWIAELWNVFRKGKAQVPLNFALLYGAGSALLTWYSIGLGDTVFILLNAGATFLAVANIAFNLASRKK